MVGRNMMILKFLNRTSSWSSLFLQLKNRDFWAMTEGKYSLFAQHSLEPCTCIDYKNCSIGRCVKTSAFRWQAQSTTRQKNENDDEADEECYIDDDDDDQDDGGDDSELLYSCI